MTWSAMYTQFATLSDPNYQSADAKHDAQQVALQDGAED